MRTVEEIRSYFLTRLYWSLRRPGMYGHGRGLDIYYHLLLDDLCFIDEKDTILVRQYLEKNHYWSSLGVYGVLLDLHIKHNLEDEIASIYAEVAYALGYIELEDTLNDIQWLQLQKWLKRDNSKRRWHQNEIIQLFGKATFSTLGTSFVINSYCNEKIPNWVTLGYNHEHILERVRFGIHTRKLESVQ